MIKKHSEQKQPREDGIYFYYMSRSQFIVEKSQSTGEKKQELEVETMTECLFLARSMTCSIVHAQLAFFCSLGSTAQGMVPPVVGDGLPHQLTLKTMP